MLNCPQLFFCLETGLVCRCHGEHLFVFLCLIYKLQQVFCKKLNVQKRNNSFNIIIVKHLKKLVLFILIYSILEMAAILDGGQRCHYNRDDVEILIVNHLSQDCQKKNLHKILFIETKFVYYSCVRILKYRVSVQLHVNFRSKILRLARLCTLFIYINVC